MRHYIGLIHKEADSDFGISFPDFPGCVSAGSTLDESLAMGREALEGHIEAMAEAGEPIPEPSDVDAVMENPENRDGVVVLVPAPDLSGKAVRVNVTLPERLLQKIDQVMPNRSRFLANAAEELLEVEDKMRVTGRILNEKWKVGALHALYREDGKWFHVLERFPGALFDTHGYVLFHTKAEYEGCKYLKINLRTNVAQGISLIPSYVKVVE